MKKIIPEKAKVAGRNTYRGGSLSLLGILLYLVNDMRHEISDLSSHRCHCETRRIAQLPPTAEAQQHLWHDVWVVNATNLANLP